MTDNTLTVDVAARRSGRTTRMLQWMANAPDDTVRVMVGYNHAAAMSALRQARDMELDIESWQFIGFEELRNYNPIPMRMGLARYFEFGFDNLDLTLQAMTHWPVRYVTFEDA